LETVNRAWLLWRAEARRVLGSLLRSPVSAFRRVNRLYNPPPCVLPDGAFDGKLSIGTQGRANPRVSTVAVQQ